jgi:aminopeptidase YwaD
LLKIGQSAKVKEKNRAFEVISELLRRNYTFAKYLSLIGIPFALFSLKIASFFMNKFPFLLLALVLLVYIPSFAQKKLKKSDRTIVSNIQAHVTFLNGDKLEERKAGTEGEKLADEYIIRQFTRSGLKPRGEKEWYQVFKIYDGKEIKPSTTLSINDEQLELYKDYFPFAFSANKPAEAAVAIALAENGVPWFKDIKELINDEDSIKADTLEVIRVNAKQAASKGATALIIYNKSGGSELDYNRYDVAETVDIPVIYLKNNAFKKYTSDESAIIDVKLNVELEAKSHTGNNVIGYADNGADSTVVTSAHLGDETDIAALIETARLVKANKLRSNNYLFVAYCGDKGGTHGEKYFNDHTPKNVKNIKNTVSLDSLAATVDNPKGLNLVKRSIEIIKTN